MNERATRARSTWMLAVLLLMLGVALGAQAEPPSSKLPGRKPGSKEPWGAFLGKAAHKRLPEFVRRLRPDITDTRAFVLFEIKPDNEEGREEGREQARRYLAALNEAVDPDKKLAGGTSFAGSLFLEFENGGALWQLSWRTPEPGVTLYRWSYRRKRPHASWKERAAQKEEALPREEMEEHGEWAEQALRAAYEGSEFPSGFQGQVYLPVDCR